MTKIKKSKATTTDGSVKKKEKSKSGKYSKVPPPKEQVAVEEQGAEDEPMEGVLLLVLNSTLSCIPFISRCYGN